MSNLDHGKLREMAAELAKTVKTQEDLSSLSSMLVKMTVEAALGAEMEEHLGYGRNQESESFNSRNGYSSKTLKGDHGEVNLSIPRDRHSLFEPVIVKKGETIALMGSSGRSTGPHVHFEVYKHGRAVDPAAYIHRASR